MLRARYVGALIAIAAAARLVSLWRLHPLNWDEIEFYRATSWVRGGLVPYRDFWEHHTPLQWFVFAPLSALARGPGASAIISMRFAQVIVWIVTFFLVDRWMRGAGIATFARLTAILLALCSSMFMLAAVEFRVDALACALLVLALVLAQRGHYAGCGAALVLAGFANVRLGPLLVVAVIAFAIQRRDRALRLVAGIFVAAASCAAYFVVTQSVAVAWQRVLVDNYLADHWAARAPGIFLHRLSMPFGLTAGGFDYSAVDLPTIVILVIGVIGLVRALVERSPQFVVLAILQIANIAFIALMKFVQTYHFEAVVIVMLPFVAGEVQRWSREKAFVGALTILAAINVAVSLFRGKEEDLRYQDRIMREVDRLTPPGSTVFDGAGWALQRTPAYRYWFLREIVRVLESHGRFETYRVDPANPPAALISDYGARVWLATHRDVRGYFMRHYVPYWRDLWLPGMSGVIAPGQRATWVVPANDTYAIYASPELAAHPWFRGDVSALTNLRGGKPIALRRGTPYTMASDDPRPIGVFIVPAGVTEIFRQPPKGVDIDGAPPPRWHIPHLW